MPPHDLGGDAQAEARALLLGREEGLENSPLDLFGNLRLDTRHPHVRIPPGGRHELLDLLESLLVQVVHF